MIFRESAILAPPPDRCATVRTEPVSQPGGESATPPLFWLVGARGGVGVSTLATIWEPAGDSDRRWPGREDESPYAVVVCRSNALSMSHAADLLRQYHAGQTPGHLQVVAVVVVADRPGRGLNRDARRYRDAILGTLTDTVVDIGWHPELLDSSGDNLPRWEPGMRPTRKVRAIGSGDEITADLNRAGTEIVARIERLLTEQRTTTAAAAEQIDDSTLTPRKESIS